MRRKGVMLLHTLKLCQGHLMHVLPSCMSSMSPVCPNGPPIWLQSESTQYTLPPWRSSVTERPKISCGPRRRFQSLA